METNAYFYDNNNNLIIANIKYIQDRYIVITAYDKDDNEVGYMHIYFHINNRLYLDVIYCYEDYRKNGIATNLSELADYLLKDYQGYLIRGVYMPGQLSTDSERQYLAAEYMDKAARSFYNKNGYSIIDYEEYLQNKDKYPFLLEDDFYLSEEDPTTIVYKMIDSKNYNYYEENNIIKSLKLK